MLVCMFSIAQIDFALTWELSIAYIILRECVSASHGMRRVCERGVFRGKTSEKRAG